MRQSFRLALLLVFATSCKKNQETPPVGEQPALAATTPVSAPEAAPAVAPTPAANADLGFCQFKVEGALTGEGKSPGGASALGSDYFMSEDEMRQALTQLEGAAKVDEAMKRDPRMYLFVLNCQSEILNINFGGGPEMKSKDFPFGPGKYSMGDPKGIRAQVTTKKGDIFQVQAGSFELSRFSGQGAAGTFAFEAKKFAAEDVIRVAGSFDMPCSQPTSVCRTP